jgi:ribosomal protein L29
MKTKNKKELHIKSIKELQNMIAEAKDALVGLKLEKIQNKLKNTSSIAVKKREVAQMLTVVRIKELVEREAKNK